jgi:hypothetical protein
MAGLSAKSPPPEAGWVVGVACLAGGRVSLREAEEARCFECPLIPLSFVRIPLTVGIKSGMGGS